MGGLRVCRQVLLVLLAGAPPSGVLSQDIATAAPPAALPQPESLPTDIVTEPPSAVAQPLDTDVTNPGCFSYGYKFFPAMQNITGMPFSMATEQECQMKCRMTTGCFHFAFFRNQKECWLGDLQSHIIKAMTKGVVCGKAYCPEEAAACVDIPGPDFPASTVDATRAAWPGGEQPTNLQCWPRQRSGFPDKCRTRMATVLEDTAAGWPGRCDNMRKVDDLQPGETCQLRCFNSALCGVWSVENVSQNGVPTCWHAMNGMNCYKGSGYPPMRAQRVMHGTFRVLMNTMGMQIMNLTRAFEGNEAPTAMDGIRRCRKTCLSYLFCQFWQYSTVWGCWIEDPSAKPISYPLVNNGKDMVTEVDTANTVKAGEYIQHFCADGAVVPLPTDSPETGAAAAPMTGRAALAGVNAAHKTLGDGESGPQDVAAGEVDQGSSIPTWASILIGFAIALCVVVLGIAIWITVIEADKPGTRGGKYGRPGSSRMSSMSSGGDSRNSSFASESQPFMHGSFGSHMPQSSHWQYQQQQAAGVPTSHSLAGQAAQFFHWNQGGNQPPGYGQQAPQSRGWM